MFLNHGVAGVAAQRYTEFFVYNYNTDSKKIRIFSLSYAVKTLYVLCGKHKVLINHLIPDPSYINNLHGTVATDVFP